MFVCIHGASSVLLTDIPHLSLGFHLGYCAHLQDSKYILKRCFLWHLLSLLHCMKHMMSYILSYVNISRLPDWFLEDGCLPPLYIIIP